MIKKLHAITALTLAILSFSTVNIFSFNVSKTSSQNFSDLENINFSELTLKYGSPLYLYSEDKIRNNCRMFNKALNENFANKAKCFYASKAFSCPLILKILNEENFGVDVVSAGELLAAKYANFPMENVVFHGNNKSLEELNLGLNLGVGKIVVDNLEELSNVISINKSCNILLRIRPGIDAHTETKTGNVDSKFGLSVDEAKEAIKIIQNYDNINLLGLHCHLGSQIFNHDSYIKEVEFFMDLLSQIRSEYGITLKELDLGGGFGVQTCEADNTINIPEAIKDIADTFKKKTKELNFPIPFIYFEPGRSIVSNAACTLYTVGSIKKIIELHKTYVAVDGCMADNPQYALYKRKYDIVNLSAKKRAQSDEKIVTVIGKCCENGDRLAENISLETPIVGDILCVKNTGAYTFVKSMNYNKMLRPAVLLLKSDGTIETMIRRQTYKDLLACEINL